jgi:UDP-glucose 4-epimerase
VKIVITGGAGFIGSHLAEKLLAEGHTVTTLDNLSNGKLNYLHSIMNHPSHTFVHGSALDRTLLNDVMEDGDAIFHLAAVLGVKNTVENPLKVIEGNIDATRNVLELAYARKSKVIFSSTSEVYGKNNSVPFSEDSSRILGPTTTNRWCYATAKALDEHLCFAYAEKGLPVTIVRYFNSYGPRATSSQYGGVIPKFIKAALTGNPITVYGDGTQTRCFTYIDDTVNGTIRCLESQFNNQVFNIGNNQPVSIIDLAYKIKELTNSSSNIQYLSYKSAYGKGYEDTPFRIPDLQKSRDMLGFQPQIDIETGLRKTIPWYEEILKQSGKDVG